MNLIGVAHLAEIHSLFLLLIAVVLFLVVGNVLASHMIKKREAAGRTLSQIGEEFEIRKSIFTIIGGVSFLFGAIFSFYEFGLKLRAEDRQTLYGALSQLIQVEGKRPEISAAALLQLDRLGASSDAERPALVQIVSAYLNERAKKPVSAHHDAITARADIQMAVYVLSRLLNGDPELGQLVELKELDFRLIRIENLKLVNIRMLGIDFRGAKLSGADLTGSNLTGSLLKDTVLKNVIFKNSILDLVKFEGSDVSSTNFCNVQSKKHVKFENLRNDESTKCAHR